MPPLPSRLPTIFGTATMNEKGQIVIPAEARSTLGLEAGTRFVVLQAPMGRGLIVIEANEVEQHMRSMFEMLQAPDQESEA